MRSILQRRGGTLERGSSRVLSGIYSDAAVTQMAGEEAELGVLSDTWGENTEPRTIEAVIEAGGVSEHLVRDDLHRRLAPNETRLERLRAHFGGRKREAIRAVDGLESAESRTEQLVGRCENEGLAPPLDCLRRQSLEITGLVLLGVGDLYFVSSAFQIFGLTTSRAIGFLPFSQLQVAAVSVIVAMLVLTRITGHLLRSVTHFLERYRVARESGDPRLVTGAKARLVSGLVVVGAAVTGIGVLIVGLAEVRSTFFHDSGTPAPSSLFYCIQIGVAFAAIVMSYMMSHPLDGEWRSTLFRLRRAERRQHLTYRRLAHLVGRHNALLRERAAMILTHEDWSLALSAEVRRQVVLAARTYLIAQPEPVRASILGELPAPPVPLLVAEVGAQLEGWRSTLCVYEPLSMEDVDERLGSRPLEDQELRLFDVLDGKVRP